MEKTKIPKDYYIGLDIGTDSVGWAVTDTEYNIQKFNGNAQWGIRLIEESQTADERRAFRTARRRTQRAKFRLECLEMLFNEEIAKEDPSFFQRLHESNLYEEDRKTDGKYSVFNDVGYSDIDYHNSFNTIYHLRRHFVENRSQLDVRHLYLAVSHIVKNRGHFLFDSDSLGNNTTISFDKVLDELTTYLFEEYELSLDCRDKITVQNILKDKKMNIKDKKARLAAEFAIDKKEEPAFSILSLLAGATVSSAAIFDDEELKNTEAAKLSFSSSFDDKAAIYESALGDRFELILRLKAIYDWAILADILNEKEYISLAKCDVFEKHKRDLALLKKYVKIACPSKKNLIFSTNDGKTANYLAYSGHSSKKAVQKKCSYIDFIDFLKKQLPKEPISDEYCEMYSEIAAGTFLPKLVTKDNSVIPMQLNKSELLVILDNASQYHAFLNKRDADGKTIKEKILDVFSFRIPYYVGPLNSHSDRAWLVRTSEKIYPWNFERVVDVDKSAEKFIENLTSKCTYIHKADVLPKNSLLYSKYTVLNELNNLKINGSPISVELKQKIFTELFLSCNKVSMAKLKSYLKSEGIIDAEVTGIDNGFANTLKPWRDLANLPLTLDEKEEIIKIVTIFGDDRKLMRKRLDKQFGSKLSEDDIVYITKLKYSGWGRLSRDFLEQTEAVCYDTGEISSIIGFMWTTNCNLMQLLSKDYGFIEKLNEINGESNFTSLRKEVEELYVSPKVKRPIYQAMQIVEELVKINGCQPKKIFIEVARGEQAKKRTVSRKQKLIDLYKSLKKDNGELYSLLESTEENEFRRDALYLYFTQLGKCMYTGKKIPVEEIFNRNLYDIDHIFPQSKIKDDSLDNRVLVTKVSNAVKTNEYPIAEDIRAKMAAHWKLLLDKDLISKKKYERLVRSYGLTADELSTFINRQLVETQQSTKAIAQLLEKRYDSKIVYVKARLASEFRQEYDFIKSRDVNDFHHAKDAYLNIVVGNVYDTKFTQKFFISDLQSGKVSLNAMFKFDINGAWVTKGHKSIDIVKKMMSKNNIRFTRYSSKQGGGLFDQTLQKKGGGQAPLKKNSPLSDIDKYGGYNKASSTYFALVSYVDAKGILNKQFIPVDLYTEKEYIADPVGYVSEKLVGQLNKKPFADVKVIIPCIKYNTLVSVDGFRMHISSKDSGGAKLNIKPAAQLVLSSEQEKAIKRMAEYLNKCADLNTVKEVTKYDGINKEDNEKIYYAILDKLANTTYKVKFSNIANTMEEGSSLFKELTLYNQCKVIMQLLAIIHANVCLGDLSLIGGAVNAGKIRINSKIYPSKTTKSFKIIHQSVTGLFEQEIELMD